MTSSRGGALGDSITSGAGEDVILGDTGSYVSAHVTGTGSLTSEILSFGGDDFIQSEDGNDLILAGLGNDLVEVGNGDDLALGDDGTVTFLNFTDPQTIEATNPELGGDDTVTADGTIGDNILFGQAGMDSVTGGETEDIIVGDLALIELTDAAAASSGQSAADRLSYLEGIRPDIGYDDELYGQGGRDVAFGGFGDDDIFGGDAQDILVGDTAILVRSLTPTGGGFLDEEITIDTNFAFLTGGYDEIDGEAGADIMIGNLGPDLFFGNYGDRPDLLGRLCRDLRLDLLGRAIPRSDARDRASDLELCGLWGNRCGLGRTAGRLHRQPAGLPRPI